MGNLTNFDLSTQKSQKSCLLMGCLWPKYIIFEFAKSRGVIFVGTEDWCKIWRETDLCFPKWHEECGKFSPQHSKVSKLGLWWNLLNLSRTCSRLELTEELYVMKMKNNPKFEQELTCQFKIDMRNLANFDTSTQKFQKFPLLWAAFDQSVQCLS